MSDFFTKLCSKSLYLCWHRPARPLNPKPRELARARRHTGHLYVISLEGCVAQGWLAQLLAADLDKLATTQGVTRARAGRVVARALLTTDRLVARLRRMTRTQLP